jgi:hypothetical protein
MAQVLQHGEAAQLTGISRAGTGDLDGGMIFPSPAGSYLKPAAAGVQALSMNSLRSAWTPALAGLKTFHYAGEGKSQADPVQFFSNSSGREMERGARLDAK